ncbi:septum formation protein Maf [Anaerocolumna cellulosilytica]|uniref:dTTP/UTP pyrophosphatase n=1 Tax=Anaerocolumna cellulosilytica TaxID=433286 RepID=A0A6S6R6K9_9FIRM|nr:Maf family protein [Anaerocolumna cellulosilytica]MBB5196546.1 septum formation protein [Anaerocolumna cellulosilytica]BCJ95647.1 septum formation protein Maf [Anaerocolumna cellulosilytica]
MYKVILASGSPRRREILQQAGIEFVIKTSNKEEVTDSTTPEEMVKALALQKAEDVLGEADEDTIIIGADTLVAIDNRVLGKPDSKEAAKEMLIALQGKRHQVYTGVAVLVRQSNRKEKDKKISFSEVSQVWVQPMEEEEIEAYIATGEPFDKAGGYGIQGKFAVHIEKIEGDYLNIVGFPIAKLYTVLKEEGIDILRL